MTNQLQGNKYWGIEISLAKLYIYLLPIRMIVQFSGLKLVLYGAGIYFDVLLNGIGIFLMIMRSHGVLKIGSDYSSRLMRFFVQMVIFFNASSIVMAAVIQFIYGDYAGESAFSGITGMQIYFIQYALMIFYNKQIFNMISKEEILKIIQRICLFLLILGYCQILALNYGEILTIIEKIDIFKVLYPESSMPKLSLTTLEGASAGGLISIFVLPFLYSQVITQANTGRYIIQVFLWLPVLYYTSSSTGYILFVVVTLFFIFLRFKNTNQAMTKTVFLAAISIFMLIVIIFPNYILSLLPDQASGQVKYLLLEKVFDRGNGSVAMRLTPFYMNYGAFCEFPIFGVGNGLQGYFFEKYVPDFFFTSSGYDAKALYYSITSSISNGSLFFPSILSGYGIVGASFFGIYIYRLLKLAFIGKKQLESFYYMFLLAAAAVFVTGFQGDFTGMYYLWFMMSLPYLAKIQRRKEYRRGDIDEKNSDFSVDSNNESSENTKQNIKKLSYGNLYSYTDRCR
jgi:hypothetical protein